MISLIVKGSRFQAASAAASRGIPFAFCGQIYNLEPETRGKTGDQFRDKVVAWFVEEPRVAPYPAGTLLLYTEGVS